MGVEITQNRLKVLRIMKDLYDEDCGFVGPTVIGQKSVFRLVSDGRRRGCSWACNVLIWSVGQRYVKYGGKGKYKITKKGLVVVKRNEPPVDLSGHFMAPSMIMYPDE